MHILRMYQHNTQTLSARLGLCKDEEFTKCKPNENYFEQVIWQYFCLHAI